MGEVSGSSERVQAISEVFFYEWSQQTFGRPVAGYGSIMMDSAINVLKKCITGFDRDDAYCVLEDLSIVTLAFYEILDEKIDTVFLNELRAAEVEQRPEMIKVLVGRLREIDAEVIEDDETAVVQARMKDDIVAAGEVAIGKEGEEVSRFD